MADNPANPVPPDYFERFVSEIEAIRKAVEFTNKLIPEERAKAANDLASFYERGFSASASRGSGSNDPVVAELERMNELLAKTSRIQDAQSQMQSFGSASTPGLSDTDLRRLLGQLGGGGPGGVSGPSGGVDYLEREGLGYRSNTSRPKRSWGDRFTNPMENIRPEHIEGGVLEAPRSEGAQFTAADAFNWLRDMSGSLAAKQSARVTEAGGDPEQDAKTRTLARVSGAFDVASEAAPKARLIRQYASRLGVMAEPGSLEAQGAQLGVSPAGTDVGLGPVGFRVPYFNAASRAAIEREWDIGKMRSQAGVNGEQARYIFDQLNARGFRPQSDFMAKTGGISTLGGIGSSFTELSDQAGSPNAMRQTPSFNAMSKSAAWMQKNHPELVNEEYFTLMDKATRAGAASLDAFNKNMTEVETVAKSTGYSMQQLQADMDAVGQTYEQMGGTHFGGQQAAVQWQGLTKLPAALLPGLLKNPWVQTQSMQRYGLMPWEQGLMNGSEQALSSSGAIMQMYKQTSGMGSLKENLGDGFSRTISSQDRRIALLHQQFPDVPVDKLKQMINDYPTIQARGRLEDRANAWSHAVGAAKNNPAALKRLFGHGAGNYGALAHEMTAAGFTKDEESQVYKAGAGGNYLWGKNHDKMVNYLAKHKGVTEQQYLATQRYNKIEDIINKKGDKVGKSSDHVITVKMDSNPLKKGLFFSTKQKARAGQVNINLPYSQGPSPSPSGVPDTSTFDPSLG